MALTAIDRSLADSVATLKKLGVNYIDIAENGKVISFPRLLRVAFKKDADTRLRRGIVLLALVHPDLFPKLKPAARVNRAAKLWLTAAACIQTLYRSRISNLMDNPIRIPFTFASQLGIHDPEKFHGRWGLMQVADKLRELSGVPYNYEAEFEQIIEGLWWNLRRRSK